MCKQNLSLPNFIFSDSSTRAHKFKLHTPVLAWMQQKIHLLLRVADLGIICHKYCVQIQILIHLEVLSKMCTLKATKGSLLILLILFPLSLHFISPVIILNVYKAEHA